MISTSYFSIQGLNPKAVSIARRTPPGFRGRWYEPLAPPSSLLWWYLRNKPLLPKEELERQYTETYTRDVLDRLDPATVAREIGDEAVLLCYEKSYTFCHRRLVADWLAQALGIVVEEIDTRYTPPQLKGDSDVHPVNRETSDPDR